MAVPRVRGPESTFWYTILGVQAIPIYHMACLFFVWFYWRDAYEQMWYEAPTADSLDMHDPFTSRIRIVAFGGFYGAPLDGNCVLDRCWTRFIRLWCCCNDMDWWFHASASMSAGNVCWTVKFVHFLHTDYRLVHIQSVVNICDCGWFPYWMALVLNSSVLVPASDHILMPLFFSIFSRGVLSAHILDDACARR